RVRPLTERAYPTRRSSDLDAILVTPHGAHASLPLFTYVAVRSALLRAGEDDIALADMVAGTVLEFAIRDRAQRIADVDDEVYVRSEEHTSELQSRENLVCR